MENFNLNNEQPQWRTVFVDKNLPERLRALDVLSKNIWWCWNQNAIEFFKRTDLGKWTLTGGNPIAMLERISLKRYKELVADASFLEQMDAVYNEFNEYM